MHRLLDLLRHEGVVLEVLRRGIRYLHGRKRLLYRLLGLRLRLKKGVVRRLGQSRRRDRLSESATWRLEVQSIEGVLRRSGLLLPRPLSFDLDAIRLRT